VAREGREGEGADDGEPGSHEADDATEAWLVVRWAITMRRVRCRPFTIVVACATVACGQASPGGSTSGQDSGVEASAPGGGDAGGPLDAAATDSGGAEADAGAPFVAAAHRSFPSLAKNTGRVLAPLTLVTIVASNDSLSAELFAFGDALASSAWWHEVGAPYALGAATSVHATGPAITTNPSPADMTAYIQSLIDGATVPAPDGETCYLLYLPDGVSIASGPGPFSAYHSPYPAYGEGLGDGWVVVSRSTPYGGGETQLEELTRVASHEVLEAATDPGWTSYAVAPAATPPWKGSVWSVFQVPGPVEGGDLCEGTRTFEPAGGSEYQRILAPSPPADGDPCLPAHAEPYYDVSAPGDWYALGADAGAVSIPITGWSAAVTDEWLVIATVTQASAGFASLEGTLLEVASPLAGVGMCLGAGMNNGVTASLGLSAPAGATSGDYAVVLVESFRVDPATCFPALAGDQFHMWLVGVYVP
jgi:hypothetical protein